MAPSDFRRSAVFAAMEQDEIGTAAGFQEVGFDIADNDRAVLISGIDLLLEKTEAAVDGDGLTGHGFSGEREHTPPSRALGNCTRS
jgi:hypothetical protein